MNHSADRLSGAACLVFGLALYFGIIPAFVETVEYGWVHPNTIPNATAMVLAVCGALLMLKPTSHQIGDTTSMMFAAFYLGLLVAGIALMARFGFVYAGPVLALAIMLAIGERRPLWLAAGVVGTPVAIWTFVSMLLGRPLP